MMLPGSKIKLSFAITLAVLSCIQVQAQSVKPVLLGQTPTFNPKGQFNQSLIFAAPPPPPDIGEPGQRTDAGSRGCGGDKRLAALVPVYSNSELVFGTAIASHPTFWFYVPYQSSFPAKFVLRDKDGKLIYQTDVTLPKTPGVTSFSLPSTVAPLEINKQYHWYFKIYCKAQEPPAFADGWIQRTSLNPALKSQLEKATPQQRVALYATNGIWFEALSTAGELRRRNPRDTSWAALLQSVGLNDLANEPITP